MPSRIYSHPHTPAIHPLRPSNRPSLCESVPAATLQFWLQHFQKSQCQQPAEVSVHCVCALISAQLQLRASPELRHGIWMCDYREERKQIRSRFSPTLSVFASHVALSTAKAGPLISATTHFASPQLCLLPSFLTDTVAHGRFGSVLASRSTPIARTHARMTQSHSQILLVNAQQFVSRNMHAARTKTSPKQSSPPKVQQIRHRKSGLEVAAQCI